MPKLLIKLKDALIEKDGWTASVLDEDGLKKLSSLLGVDVTELRKLEKRFEIEVATCDARGFSRELTLFRHESVLHDYGTNYASFFKNTPHKEGDYELAKEALDKALATVDFENLKQNNEVELDVAVKF